MRSGFHGMFRSRPALRSSSTSRRTASSLPAAMSRFICSSHSSSFQPCSHPASSARSSDDSCSMASLICSMLTFAKFSGLATFSQLGSRLPGQCQMFRRDPVVPLLFPSHSTTPSVALLRISCVCPCCKGPTYWQKLCAWNCCVNGNMPNLICVN